MRRGRKVRAPGPVRLRCARLGGSVAATRRRPARAGPFLTHSPSHLAAGLPIAASTHLAHLQLVPSAKAHARSPSQDRADRAFIPHSTYSFELFTVASKEVLSEHWPEESERERQWVEGWDALKAAVAWGDRGELMLAAADIARVKLSSP